jgi:protein-S-isoprenylcysteine O-methyltransferase Ste14
VNPGKLLASLVLQTALAAGIMATLLFGTAGDWRWPGAWAFLIIFVCCSAFLGAWLIRRDPGLLAARLDRPVQKGQPLWDRIFIIAIIFFWCAWFAAMALDAKRWHVSQVPPLVEVVGGALVVIGLFGVFPVFAANSFAAPVVRVQSEREQHVIDTGPYAWVRHPMYATALLYLIGLPLLLGSWYGLIGTAIIGVAVSIRAIFEERKLENDLPGYAEYKTRVRYRLIPGVW